MEAISPDFKTLKNIYFSYIFTFILARKAQLGEALQCLGMRPSLSLKSCFCCETSEVLLAFSVPLLIWKMGIVMVALTAEGCDD